MDSNQIEILKILLLRSLYKCFMMHLATRACSNSTSEVLWCDCCAMIFALPATLQAHTRTHVSERPFRCLSCTAAFSQSTTLSIHNQIHWYQNPISTLTHQYTPQSDAWSLSETKANPGLNGTEISYLPSSISLLGNDKVYKCTKCDKSFSCNAKLDRHMRVHSGIKPYTCEYCGKSFAYSTSCRRHERTHVEGKPFKCTHCQKAFSDSTNMKAHIRIHTGEKPYRCTICGREFSHSSSLKSHHRTHTGEKPFKCEHCGTCFGHLSTLRKHGIRAHGVQKRSSSLPTQQRVLSSTYDGIVSSSKDDGELVVKTEENSYEAAMGNTRGGGGGGLCYKSYPGISASSSTSRYTLGHVIAPADSSNAILSPGSSY